MAEEAVKNKGGPSSQKQKTGVKKNPLKNNAVLFRLNPYAKTVKRNAQQEQAKKTKQMGTED